MYYCIICCITISLSLIVHMLWLVNFVAVFYCTARYGVPSLKSQLVSFPECLINLRDIMNIDLCTNLIFSVQYAVSYGFSFFPFDLWPTCFALGA